MALATEREPPHLFGSLKFLLFLSLRPSVAKSVLSTRVARSERDGRRDDLVNRTMRRRRRSNVQRLRVRSWAEENEAHPPAMRTASRSERAKEEEERQWCEMRDMRRSKRQKRPRRRRAMERRDVGSVRAGACDAWGSEGKRCEEEGGGCIEREARDLRRPQGASRAEAEGITRV